MSRNSPRVAALALLLLLSGACGPEGADPPELGTDESALRGANGLARNGLSRNGLSRNGLSRNGLDLVGLSSVSLNTLQFQTWFDGDPAASSSVMSYIYKCAADAKKTLSWTHPVTRVKYSWKGELGLAPGWVSGKAPTLAEKQIISACLIAHTNKFGMSVPISILGKGATGIAIPYDSQELATYNVQEGCFFGDLFEDLNAAFAALDHSPYSAAHSTARACGMDTKSGALPDCSPIQMIGECARLCTKAKSSDPFYSSCTYGGKSYLPITTRFDQAYIYKCGDGVCQASESCGTGTTYDNCGSDCGPCN